MLISPCRADDGELIYLFYCPGCKHPHFARTVPSTTKPPEDNHVWSFNGNFEKPTFSPSINVRYAPEEKTTCHFFIVDGTIQYCGDCTHQYSGQTIPMISWEDWRMMSDQIPHLLVGFYWEDSKTRGFQFKCPACLNYGNLVGIHHVFLEGHGGVVWEWNKSWDCPTFSPSLRVMFGALGDCHLTITNGVIQYHEDSFHFRKTLKTFGDMNIEMIDYDMRPIVDGKCT